MKLSQFSHLFIFALSMLFTIETAAFAATYIGSDLCIEIQPINGQPSTDYRAFQVAFSTTTNNPAADYYQIVGHYNLPDTEAAGAVIGSAFLTSDSQATLSLTETHSNSGKISATTYIFTLYLGDQINQPPLYGIYSGLTHASENDYLAKFTTGTASIDWCSKTSFINSSSLDNDQDSFTDSQGDCNDSDPEIFPGATEICGDGIDQDCSGTDELCPGDFDADGDGFSPNQGDCNDQNIAINPDASEVCGNAVDENCDGASPPCPTIDVDNDGFSPDAIISAEKDCDDNSAAIYPGAIEICGDGIDQDCSGADTICDIDRDDDGDGYSENQNDCNDTDPAIKPGATEILDNQVDENCDGLIAYTPITDSTMAMKLIGVAGGCFIMGNNSGASNEKPEHNVCVDTFYMAETELTEAQYEKATGRTSKNTGHPTYPAVNIAPIDAISLITEIRTKTGKNYRLPTEAEWEFAASNRGGTIDLSSPSTIAWYQSNSSGVVHSVKTRAANPLGIYDLFGNVEEIVNDVYESTYTITGNPMSNPTGPLPSANPVNDGYISRGGHFNSTATNLTPTKRVITGSTHPTATRGIRLVLNGPN